MVRKTEQASIIPVQERLNIATRSRPSIFFLNQKAVIENILCCSDLYLSAPFDYFIFLNKVTKEIWLNTQGSVAICIHSTTMLKLFEK